LTPDTPQQKPETPNPKSVHLTPRLSFNNP